MLLDALERYARLNSPIHRLPAWIKLLGTLAIIIGIIAIPRAFAWMLAPFALLLITLIALSRLPVRVVLLRLLLVEPLVIGVALLSLLQPGGWMIFALIVARCTLCLLAVVLLSGTTPFNQLLNVLKRARIPGILITTLALMYRYLFVLVDESQRMRTARAARTFTHRRWWHWRINSSAIAQLFVRASERAERIYLAMCARGWR